jgi:hypothetical protein
LSPFFINSMSAAVALFLLVFTFFENRKKSQIIVCNSFRDNIVMNQLGT